MSEKEVRNGRVELGMDSPVTDNLNKSELEKDVHSKW